MTAEKYKSAGVDLDAADIATKKIAALAKATFTADVASEIGAFGGIYRFPSGTGSLLVASADGVGTKLKVASTAGVLNTVGQDLINHCVNDILTLGAKPLFFLDYIGYSDLEPEEIARIVEGLSIASSANGLALIGGETEQMPGIYSSGEFDLVGFIVGTAKEDDLITGAAISPGDKLIALVSNGLQTNGYSLARNVLLDEGRFDVGDRPEILAGKSVGEALLAIHPSYLKPVEAVRGEIGIAGMAHITGGGLPGNFSRILPKTCNAIFDVSKIPSPPIFELIRTEGEIEIAEMFDVFNMGAGYVIAVKPEDADRAMDILRKRGDSAVLCGEIAEGEGEVILKGIDR
ncbi:MAG TPA: phosphoribosylformylglycinamidine cyclo-ligase [candidate division Zixibacteria bacterium]|nr:phosphoribosylformylglycinamidine cyclo-ligase [candidate division Zixibacteria bacterium]